LFVPDETPIGSARSAYSRLWWLMKRAIQGLPASAAPWMPERHRRRLLAALQNVQRYRGLEQAFGGAPPASRCAPRCATVDSGWPCSMSIRPELRPSQ